MNMKLEVIKDFEANIWLETRCREDDGVASLR
jgi:hypothetical protein